MKTCDSQTKTGMSSGPIFRKLDARQQQNLSFKHLQLVIMQFMLERALGTCSVQSQSVDEAMRKGMIMLSRSHG